ncbi:hypothetical protein GLOIN_2v1779898 [Rhizophagus clarus]|uniref:Uncharacterized protein n=1 Tax=Rhizophagus clarus TaxID=94130 RepID=A0A8H3QXH7_9GLOM|nr:hypothetical protein GLOIN_2v1779898 [Rhizophagus clarus]
MLLTRHFAIRKFGTLLGGNFHRIRVNVILCEYILSFSNYALPILRLKTLRLRTSMMFLNLSISRLRMILPRLKLRDELKSENAELKNENAKLRRIIKENARHDAKNAEHEVRIEELKKNTCLIQKAWDAKDEAIQANQKELLCWCFYIVEFDKKTIEFTIKYKVGEKKSKRARNIYKLFEKIGIDKSSISQHILQILSLLNIGFTDEPQDEEQNNALELNPRSKR